MDTRNQTENKKSQNSTHYYFAKFVYNLSFQVQVEQSDRSDGLSELFVNTAVVK